MFFIYLFILLYSPYILYLLYNKFSPLEIYNKLLKKKFGKQVFNYIIGIRSPYTNTIQPSIDYFSSKKCICSIVETNSVKNPFNSIHALALGNLGELTSGLLMMELLHKKNYRGIITKIECEYYKKARRKIIAVCEIENLNNDIIFTNLYNDNCELVGKIISHWEINYKQIDNYDF